MKVQYSKQNITPFGGINFVLEMLQKKGIGDIVDKHLPPLSSQSTYKWRDFLYSLWSVYFCGADCIEDLSTNLKPSLSSNPYVNLPSPDSVLRRLKQLAEPVTYPVSKRSSKIHQFAKNPHLNALNLQIINRLGLINGVDNTLDYDNIILPTNKADAKITYQKLRGYTPGVGFIGKQVVYVENRNGNSDAQSFQGHTIERMLKCLDDSSIKISQFRADSASYLFDVINQLKKRDIKFYIRATLRAGHYKEISRIKRWKDICINDEQLQIAEFTLAPFEKHYVGKGNKPVPYRFAVIRVARKDKQINLFTEDAYLYKAVITNDFDTPAQSIITFYNHRGTAEKNFDVLRNDFGWKNLPFSKINQNSVYLIMTAICNNIYNYVINHFSKKYKGLKPSYRIKKFTFRFICISAKWIRTSRQDILKIFAAKPPPHFNLR